MYLTYKQYQKMGGTLDETTFKNFEFEAECMVNWYTFDRLKDEEDSPVELQRCMMKLIELAKLQADALALGSQTVTTTDADGNVSTIETSSSIASQSNDGVSISYNTVSASEAFKSLTSRQKGNPIETTIQFYLRGVVNSLGRKVLYRGLYPGE